MNFRGHIFYPQHNLFYQLVFPFAQVNKRFQTVYNFILKIIWNELISGKKIESEAVSLVFFVIFCVLSFIVFYLQDYRQIIILFFLILWYIDGAIAHRYYRQFKNKFPISLESDRKQLIIKNNFAANQVIESQVDIDAVRSVSIRPKFLYSKGFKQNIGTVWQVILNINNGREFLVDEQFKSDRAVNRAFQQAKLITSQLEIPMIFNYSEGNCTDASQPLTFDNNFYVDRLQINRKPNRVHIYLKWKLTDTWQFLGEVIAQAGFLLFVIISTGFMVKFGSFLQEIYQFYWQKDFNFDFKNLLTFQQQADYFIILFAITIILIEGIRKSQTQHIYIEKNILRYKINRSEKARLNLTQLEAILFLPVPTPMVLVLTENEAMTINHLPSLDTYREMVEKIEAAITISPNNTH